MNSGTPKKLSQEACGLNLKLFVPTLRRTFARI
jgi:hypothetical protein